MATDLTVVIPLRDRVGDQYMNCLASLELQSYKPKVLIVDYYSEWENSIEIDMDIRMRPDLDIQVQHVGIEEEVVPWSLARARNIGIRLADTPYVACVDVDLILEPQVLKEVHDILVAVPIAYISSRIKMLLDGIDYSIIRLPRDYELFRHAPGYISRLGMGGLVCSSKTWFERCQGYDERMTFWGSEDTDMWHRATRALRATIHLDNVVDENAGIYHQFHADSLSMTGIRELPKDKHDIVMANRKIALHDQTIIRNDKNWGMI